MNPIERELQKKAFEHAVEKMQITKPSVDVMQDILEKAIKATTGDRNIDYGDPRENHARTAELWTAYLRKKLKEDLSASDVCILNILQKISRASNLVTEDTTVDIAGFAANLAAVNFND